MSFSIDRIFAENLGLAFGGCVRDLSANLFDREIAASVKAPYNPLPFIGGAAKRRIKAAWAALLQGIALQAAVNTLPEYTDEKLVRKTLFNMQTFVDQALERPILSHMPADEVTAYEKMRTIFIRSFQPKNADFTAVARRFLEAFHGQGASVITDDTVNETVRHMLRAYDLFVKIINISVNQPSSYQRGSDAAKN